MAQTMALRAGQTNTQKRITKQCTATHIYIRIYSSAGDGRNNNSKFFQNTEEQTAELGVFSMH